MPREVRDLLAESMRRAALNPGLLPFDRIGEDGREEWRRRADHVMRLLEGHGAEIVVSGAPRPAVEPASGAIVSHKIIGQNAERSVRVEADGRISIVTTEGETATVEQTFTLAESALLAGMVLSNDAEAAKRQGLGRLLAAALEAYQRHAVGGAA